MKNSLDIKKTIYYSVLAIELILYMVYMIIDVSNPKIDTTFIKYAGMIVLGLFTLIEYRTWDKKHIAFRIAFLSTLIADMFLLVINDFYEIGISFFLITQISYFIYQIIGNNNKRTILITLITYILLVTAGIIGLISFNMVETANILALLYFFLLILNFIYSVINPSKNAKNSVLSIGFSLFLCCDICVGLNNLDVILSNNTLYFFISYAMWMFYLPSQVLIVSSLDKKYI